MVKRNAHSVSRTTPRKNRTAVRRQSVIAVLPDFPDESGYGTLVGADVPDLSMPRRQACEFCRAVPDSVERDCSFNDPSCEAGKEAS